MSRRRRKKTGSAPPPVARPGLPPGTIVVDPNAPPSCLRVTAYGPQRITELEPATVADIEPLLDDFPVVWVHVAGLGDAETIEATGRLFGLHPLALEDVVNTHQRDKCDEYDEHLYLVVRMLESIESEHTEQLSLFLGERFVLSFAETYDDCFDPVRNRLRRPESRLRNSGADYLFYALLDVVVDSYFPVLERLGDRLEGLEDEVLAQPSRSTLARIHHTRRTLQGLRRAIWPLRDVVGGLSRGSSRLLGQQTRVFLRDCHDHALRAVDLVETYREFGSALVDVYLSSLGQRTNEVMKVLTIMATIFIPITFIAGVYGMNFDPDASPWNMPELRWRWGYPACLLLMALIALALLVWFRRKGWLGEGPLSPTTPQQALPGASDTEA